MKLQGDVCDVIWRKLGSANLDVELLEIFVADSAWSQADQRLSVEEQAHILCNAGFSLRVLGRLEEAYNALLAGLTLDEGSADINSAASDVTNLAEIARDLGRLDDALAYAKKAEAIEPRQARKAWRWQTLGNILHMRGDMDAAASAFDHTGVSWSAGSYGAYVYGEYLLDCGRSRDVITALQTYRHRNPVEAVECLRLITLGRAYLMADAGGDRQQMVAEGARLLVDTVKWIAAEDHQFESLERGDLALGELAMVKGSWADAIVHAEKALRRSHASGARIYEIESRQILAAAFAQSDRLHDAAKERQLAEDLIQVTGYHRPRHWAWSDPLADMGRS